jgi:hypothetical protein
MARIPRPRNSAAAQEGGLGDAGRFLRPILQAAMTGRDRGLEAVGIELHASMVRMLSHPGTGRIYRSRGGKAIHQASAPGQPPAPDLGEYRAAWRWRRGRNYVEIFTADKRGPWLEGGTRHMAPRPHLRPVTEQMIPRVPGIMRRYIEAEQRAANQRQGGS